MLDINSIDIVIFGLRNSTYNKKKKHTSWFSLKLLRQYFFQITPYIKTLYLLRHNLKNLDFINETGQITYFDTWGHKLIFLILLRHKYLTITEPTANGTLIHYSFKLFPNRYDRLNLKTYQNITPS